MSELKTMQDILIKDMEEKTQGAAFPDENGMGVSFYDLSQKKKESAVSLNLNWNKYRQEAIKHVKELTKELDKNSRFRKHRDKWMSITGAIAWIKQFFNITEKELK